MSTTLTVPQAVSTYAVHQGVIWKAIRRGELPAHERIPGFRNGGYLMIRADFQRWYETRRECRPFSDADIAALLELGPTCTWEQVGAYIGRSAGTCKEKARQLRRDGITVDKLAGRGMHMPWKVPSSGVLVAKTCPKCGLFRDAAQFGPRTNNASNYYPACRKCRNEKFVQSDRYRRMQENQELLDEVTRAEAVNLGKPYTAADDVIVRDTSISTFDAALQIGRTYSGIKYRREVLGIELGPKRPRIAGKDSHWVLNFPNAAAALQDHFKRLGLSAPEAVLGEWPDWADEVAS